MEKSGNLFTSESGHSVNSETQGKVDVTRNVDSNELGVFVLLLLLLLQSDMIWILLHES